MDKYVRLAYTCQYDMLAKAICSGVLENPVIICVDPQILLDKINIKYTTMNAVANSACLYDKSDRFNIDFQKVYEPRSLKTLGEEYKNARQSEILIEEYIETSYIKGIVIPLDIEYTNNINNIKIIKMDTKKLINGCF